VLNRCGEQSCELVEACYSSDIIVALCVEPKTLVPNFVGFNEVCIYFHGPRVLVRTPVVIPVVLKSPPWGLFAP